MRAILYIVRKAINMEILKVHFCSVAKEVIKALKGAEDWAKKSLVEDILDVSSNLKTSSFSYISRNFNGAAYCLAKCSFEHGKSFEWIGTFSRWMNAFEFLL